MIRASVLARLLGIRLLQLDADILLVPARASPYAGVEQPRGPVVLRAVPGELTGDLSDAAKVLAHASRTLDEAG